MSNKAYDIAKTIFSSLPLFSTFILLLKDAWGIPYAEPIAMTLGGVSTLGLGVLAEVSKNYFKDKEIVKSVDEE